MEFGKLIKKGKRKPLLDLTGDSVIAVDYGIETIHRLLPNRAPFLFLDRISGVDLRNQAVIGHRRIDPADPLFAGHFRSPGLWCLNTWTRTATTQRPEVWLSG